MMLYLLTDHDGNIITASAQPWATPGEYTRPDVFRVVVADIPDGFEAVRVTSFGESETRTYQTHEGAILCSYVYADADIETREVEA